MVLGTSSDAGKTVVTAMFCRRFSTKGLDPAPFKAFNLSLNSYATKDGGEIGMGQAFQAWSAGLEPEADMNPVLMKPSGNGVMQLMVGGRPLKDVKRLGECMDDAVAAVDVAYDRMSAKHGFLVCEGSGSPAEINMVATDLANVGLMRLKKVPAIIVADIERGGVFAAIYGTWRLVPDDVRPLLKGFVINRFRGDASILEPGIRVVEKLTGMKCLGVIPYLHLRFPAEDSLSSVGGTMNGDDPRTAYMENLDVLIDAAESNGFDFEALEEIAKDGISSA